MSETNEAISLELSREELYLLLQGCALGLQASGILSSEERTRLRELLQRIARETKYDGIQPAIVRSD
jgi:hypothetical protein